MGLNHGCKCPSEIALVLLVLILDGVPDPYSVKYTLWQIGLWGGIQWIDLQICAKRWAC